MDDNQHMNDIISDINKTVSMVPTEHRGFISDGYHTFNDLYDHRCLLYVLWINSAILLQGFAWKSKMQHDGASEDGWFISGFTYEDEQISYHLPMSLWDVLRVTEVKRAPQWDGHTSSDVIKRLSKWLGVSTL